MSVECDRMWVSSRWIYGQDSRRDPKVLNPDYHIPVLLHHDVKTGEAYFTDESGRILSLEEVPDRIKTEVKNSQMTTVPQFAPPNLRDATTDPETGQEFKAGQVIHKDILQGVPLLNERLSKDVHAEDNTKLLADNRALRDQLEALKVAPKKRGRPRKQGSLERAVRG